MRERKARGNKAVKEVGEAIGEGVEGIWRWRGWDEVEAVSGKE